MIAGCFNRSSNPESTNRTTDGAISGITVAGKTGTAELATTAGKKNDAKETDAWFVAYAPSKNPVFTLAVFMEKTGGYGAQVAAPVARDIIAGYLAPAPSPSPKAAATH